MNAREIGTEAGRIFAYKIPNDWVFRSQEDQNDFGIDGEIELINNVGQALGKNKVFKVQIKGQENSTFIKNNKILSFSLNIDRLNYYLKFKIPVILIVVEISSEKVFWIPLTNDLNLRNIAKKQANKSSIQIHLPIGNVINRNNKKSAEKMIDSVIKCWDYLTLNGLKESVKNFPNLDPELLDEKINDIGTVLFKAYHQKLNNLMIENDYIHVFEEAKKLFEANLVPNETRFIALLYYFNAFQIAPFTNSEKEQCSNNIFICSSLINIAREEKSKTYRYISIGKSRVVSFKFQLERLYIPHFTFSNSSLDPYEKYIFEIEISQTYRTTCFSLQKIIQLFNKLISNNQFGILSDIFIDLLVPMISFKKVHNERGSDKSIKFLNDWLANMYSIVLEYAVLTKEIYDVKFLYKIYLTTQKNSELLVGNPTKKILENIPYLKNKLDQIRISVKKQQINSDNSFIDSSIDEQKLFFTKMAKSHGMDPDDPNNAYGKIIKLALINYDPTDIIKNCKHLFIHYRPSGMLYNILQMHSIGPYHLIVCLKHRYPKWTGKLLSTSYNNPQEPLGFKQKYCDKCSDCIPRSPGWSWNLKWYQSELQQHIELLKKYRLF